MEEYVAMDTNGNPVPLNTLLGKIQGSEVTFTQKGSLPLPPYCDFASTDLPSRSYHEQEAVVASHL